MESTVRRRGLTQGFGRCLESPTSGKLPGRYTGLYNRPTLHPRKGQWMIWMVNSIWKGTGDRSQGTWTHVERE